jgi:hypothetical protein
LRLKGIYVNEAGAVREGGGRRESEGSSLVGKLEHVNFLLVSPFVRKTHVPITAPFFFHTSSDMQFSDQD